MATTRTSTTSICRDCGAPVRSSEAIRYGIRHYLCVSCLIHRGKKFILSLKTWQLEKLPIGPLKDAGLLEDVKAEVARRSAA